MSFFLYSHEGGLTGSGSSEAFINIFHDRTFTYPYPPGPITLAVGSDVHVQMTVPGNDPNLRVVLDDCYITPSSDPNDHARFYLIHEGYESLLIQMDWNGKSMVMVLMT